MCSSEASRSRYYNTRCMPELTVAIFAIYQGTAGISIGDILGSHVFNIGIVVGLLAAFGSLEKCSTASLLELIDLLFMHL